MGQVLRSTPAGVEPAFSRYRVDILTTRSVSWRSEDRFGQQDGECNHQLALTIENINPDWGD